jgi:hypothetical protein
MDENKTVYHWVDFETEDGKLIESLTSYVTLEEVQSLANGLPLHSTQVTTSAQDFSISVGSQLTLDEKKFKVKKVSMNVRDAKTYAEIRVFVIVEEI